MSKLSVLSGSAERLDIKDENVLKKAEEYLRYFQLKVSVSLKTLNDVAKAVLCLDLSCRLHGVFLDKEQALELSGLKKPAYQSNLNLVESILGLDKCLTILELCVHCNCTEVKELAEEMFSAYKKAAENKFKDMFHPQYRTAIVYMACKYKDIKVNKSQFIQLSRVKQPKWRELLLDVERFLRAARFGASGIKRVPKLMDISPQSSGNNVTPSKPHCEEIIEEYHVWKRRILLEAYAELEARGKKEDNVS